MDRVTYIQLAVADHISNGELATLLNASCASRLTVCPECGVDDFTHVEGCTLGAGAADKMREI